MAGSGMNCTKAKCKNIMQPLIFTALFFVTLTSLQGCNMKSQFIQDLEAARTDEYNDKGVSAAVQKYFPVGMSVDEMNKQLHLLKKDGFDIGVYKYEGAKNWPDGEFKPYTDEGTRRNLQNQYPVGITAFSGRKTYERHYFFITKTVSFHITVKDEKVIASEGSIWTSGI
jgi:hypothetical protein